MSKADYELIDNSKVEFKLPEQTDFYNITDFNDNTINTIAALTDLKSGIKSHVSSADAHSDIQTSIISRAKSYTDSQVVDLENQIAGSLEGAKAYADNAVSTHNTAKDAHENRFSIIQSQLDQKVPTAYVTGAIADHNTSANAHEVLFGTLSTRVDGLDGGLIYANAKLNTNTNAIVEALKLTGTYIVGIGQTEIANDAYQNNSNIKVVSIADSVTTIGNYAFSSDTSLTNIAIPESVTSIGNYTFAWCSSLKGITIPNSVTSIGTGICRACTSLKNATIGNGVSSIGEGIFYGCTALTSVTLGSGFNASLDISSGSYTADVMVAMFNNLKDLTGQTAKTLTLGSANLAKLTDEQKAIATNKNWNLA